MMLIVIVPTDGGGDWRKKSVGVILRNFNTEILPMLLLMYNSKCISTARFESPVFICNHALKSSMINKNFLLVKSHHIARYGGVSLLYKTNTLVGDDRLPSIANYMPIALSHGNGFMRVYTRYGVSYDVKLKELFLEIKEVIK